MARMHALSHHHRTVSLVSRSNHWKAVHDKLLPVHNLDQFQSGPVKIHRSVLVVFTELESLSHSQMASLTCSYACRLMLKSVITINLTYHSSQRRLT